MFSTKLIYMSFIFLAYSFVTVFFKVTGLRLAYLQWYFLVQFERLLVRQNGCNPLLKAD